LRIAELAATGLTNPEIASAAFVSRKTVEANLTKIYRKLGVRSRVELARELSSARSDS
jgi:DNA-binding NarL/FixJ family response regulator